VPANLLAVAGPRRVDLTWDASTAADLAGYFVYRARQSGTGYERLTPQALRAQNFSDLGLEAGVPLYYVVTAVDREGNESGYSEEAIATPLPPE
jgi:fibronectin type 3 domain-containing protein